VSSEGRALSQLPEFEIAGPDWETFEDIETYVRGEAGGFLRTFLPKRVWLYLWAPTAANRQTIQLHRQEYVSQYEAVLEVFQDAERQLRLQSDLYTGPELDNPDDELETIPQRQFPATVQSPEDCASLAEYLDAVSDALEREQTALDRCDVLLSKPEAAFLREDEREELRKAQTVLAYSVEQGHKMETAVEQKRGTVLRLLQKRVDTWSERLDELEGAAESYLDLEQYLASDDLLTAVDSISEELDDVRDNHPLQLVTHPLVERFQRLEARATKLGEGLAVSRQKYATKQFEQIRAAAKAEIEALRRDVWPARKRGCSIESPETLLDRIASLRQDIEAVSTAVYIVHLEESHVDELTQYQSWLNGEEEFIETKVWFDAKLEADTARCEQLREDASQYLSYDAYLTRPAKSELTDCITSLQTYLDSVASDDRLDLLCEADQAELEELQTTLASIESHLDEYNSEFVRRQREACSTLFSDIGPENLGLTAEQERAVIRNGIYNQVIAAAGTGKTLTLTTRIAYLVTKQGVDPGQILAVTYTNEAAAEMRQRLADHFGITGVEIETVHAFGRGILQDAQEAFVETIDANKKENFIDRQIRQARDAEAGTFLDHYYEFLVHFDETYHTEADFETKKQYLQARTKATYTTLGGTEVKSRAEKVIADFLLTHQVEYRYEDRATWAETAPEKAGYAPDFYLPEHDVYIEHWGIDESGSIAPWFSWSSEQYREKMRWARSQFETADAELIDTFEFEHSANRLQQALGHRLSLHGVELNWLDFEELVDTVFDYDQREGWIKSQFVDFIENAKRFDVMPDEIEENLSPQNPRQYHFGKCGISLLMQYALYLTENQLIDFTDMIQDAVDLIQKNPEIYQHRYNHLLVDEFQDIGKGKLELIQQLTGPDTAKLFAVGDDWQSIYSFQGAAIEYFTDFKEYFGDPVRTDLTANFRSPRSIVKAGNHLIAQNTNQLAKTVHPQIDWETTPRVHTLRGYTFYAYVRQVRRYVVGLVQEYLEEGAEPGEIMILCRYDGAVPYLDEIKNGFRSQNIPYLGESDQYSGPDRQANGGVSIYSLYQSKGREAKHVLLVHAAGGQYGFPPENRDNELLDPVQPLGVGGIEEERRAFYVAMTRAERSLDLLTRADQESQFLEEISEYTETVDTGQVEPLDDVGERMTVEVQVEKILDPWESQHQRGIVADKFGGSARFVSWKSTDPPTVGKKMSGIDSRMSALMNIKTRRS